jgi:hypothetical protein
MPSNLNDMLCGQGPIRMRFKLDVLRSARGA